VSPGASAASAALSKRPEGVSTGWTDPLSLDGGSERDQAALRALISSNRAGLR
jgi:hypothetical protein